jgi:flagellin-like protein
MNVKELFTDDEAVSPVIGVILMVAITVILAAVIGAFVLNIGGSQDTAPTSTIEFSTDTGNDTVKAVHRGGDELDGSTLSVNGWSSPDKTIKDGSTYTAGDTIVIGPSNTAVDIVWKSPNSDKSSILASWNP